MGELTSQHVENNPAAGINRTLPDEISARLKLWNRMAHLLHGAAVVLAVAGAVVRPGQWGDRFRAAWRLLDPACLKYRFDPNFEFSDLLDAVVRGERKIGMWEGEHESGRQRGPGRPE